MLEMMTPRRLVLLFALVLAGCQAFAAPPTDNAVASYYRGPEGYPAWTDQVKWSNVIDMSAYAKGTTTFEKFENARDELAAKGGGVLYYPAGIYDFTQGPFDGPSGRGLMLKSGVVIRGEAPQGPIDTATGTLPLGTVFKFGFADRSDVAIDTGERTRFLLTFPASGRTRPLDLVLSVAAKDGKLLSDVDGYLPDFPEAKFTGKAKVTEGGNGATIEVALDVPAFEQMAASKATYVLDLTRKDDRFSGTFSGTVNGQPVNGAVEGRLSTIIPETPRDWNLIGLCPEKGQRISQVNNVGICWVHLVGAAVYFGPDVDWGPTWKTAGSWKSNYAMNGWENRVPDGTHPLDPFTGGGKNYLGAGKGRLVMGCILEDSAVMNDAVNCGVSGKRDNRTPVSYPDGFGSKGFSTAKFAARIAAYGSRIFIAGNVLPKADPRNFKYVQTTVKTNGQGGAYYFLDTRKSVVLFDYNKTCGIDTNKEMLGLTKPSPTSEGTDGYFTEGVVVRDNYVYNNGHKGYNLSGAWLTIANNQNKRDYLKSGKDPYGAYGWRLTLDGFAESSAGGAGNVSDNLARAFDLGGKNIWVDGNFFDNTGSDPGNDGEGILCQAHGGTNLMSWAITHNKHEKGTGETSYMGGWGVKVHGCLIAWNKTSGWVGQAMAGDEFDSAYVANEASGVNVGKNSPAIIKAPEGNALPPIDVKAGVYEGDAVRISWTDASDNEIGFRVDRSIAGGAWVPIAYRPPHIQGTPDNPQEWVDFTAPTGKALRYRVVAVTDKDTDTGASAPTAPVTIKL